MRKNSLRKTANRYLKTDNRGSFKEKRYRAFVIHKMIDDLFTVGEMPASWQSLKPEHIQNLVKLWKKQKKKPATIMDYMTRIRRFLKAIGCNLPEIDNQSLNLQRDHQYKKKFRLTHEIWKCLTSPTARIIMGMQTQFGLTFSESIRIIPDIHLQDDSIWITREIAFNSQDRLIPKRFDEQDLVIAEFRKYVKDESLIKLESYEDIRREWRKELAKQKLPINKRYRYLYAQQLQNHILPLLGNYQTSWLIRDEMGIKSRNTLWGYLNE